MEVNASSLEKKEANEVVLLIPEVECQRRGSSPKPNTEPIELANPPSSSRISNLTSPSALELTQSIPTPRELPIIQNRKPISLSLLGKLKCRFRELRVSASTPKIYPIDSVPSPAAEEEDDEDVCETVNPKSQVVLGKRKVVLAQWVAFVCITGLLIASLTIRVLRNTVIWHVHLWGWCLLMLAIFCGRLLTHWLITLLISLIERKYLLKRNVLYFLVALKDSAEVFAWLGLLFLAWVWLIDHRVKRSRPTTGILNRVTRALASCLLGAALWLIKTFLIKLLASSFQCEKFFGMHDCILKLHVIRTLSCKAESADKLGCLGIRVLRSLKKCTEGAVIGLEEVDKKKPSKVKPDKVSKKLSYIISSLELSTLTDSLDEAEQQDKETTDEQKAKDDAKAIFKIVAKPGSQFIDEDDLSPFMQKEDVEKLYAFFPEAKERKIMQPLFENWLVKVYRDRIKLIRDLNDAKTAIEELNSLASAVLLIVVIILWLLLTGLLTTQVLIFISSQLVLFAFIFGDAAKRLFEAIVFVFVMHPFDVNDRCMIGGVEMVVEEMNIMTTVFLKNDGEKIYYPNSELASKPIGNFNRSSEMSDSVEFTVNFSTSVESIGALEKRIKEYLESELKHWRPDHSVVINEIADADNSKILKMALHVTHTMNFQDSTGRTRRRSNLLLALKEILEELHLNSLMPPQ